MNKDVLKGSWKQLRGKAQETWGKISGDEWDSIEGSYDKLVGTIQKKYGYSMDETKKHVSEFLNKADSKLNEPKASAPPSQSN